MSYFFKYLMSVVLTLSILYVIPNDTSVQAATDTENFVVKVKLINKLGPSKTYQFTPKGETVLKEDPSIILKKDITYKLTIQDSKISLFEGSKNLKSELSTLTIEPKVYQKENFVLLNNMISNVKYPHIGTIIFNLITKSNTQYIQPVNHLGFEDYLKGVLPGEMPASWGTDANKGNHALEAQAISARSYVFSKMNGNTQLEIDDTITYQVYKGFVWDPISPDWNYYNQFTNKAVEATTGDIMTYIKLNGTKGFVTAFFSASNGGQTELPQQYWSSNLPYLTKTQKDTFDPYKWSQLSSLGGPLQLKKQQLNDTNSLDFTNPSLWWNTQAENNLLSSVVSHGNSRTAFSKIKSNTLTELKKIDPSIESIKIESINNISKTDYTNTGKVKDITFNLSYYLRKKNPDNSLYYSMKLGAQSETLQGDDRYETAVKIAKQGWTSKRDSVVLGRGDLSVDALAGSVLAYKLDAPILLTRSNSLSSSVEEYMKSSLNPGATVYLLGGKVAITQEVEQKITSLGYKVNRVAGDTRNETSIAIAKLVGGSSTVFFASGNEDSPDALSISAYAARNQMPIIIQQGTKVSKPTNDYLKDTNKLAINLIGGDIAISSTVENTLKSLGFATDRTEGIGRVETSIAINEKYKMTGESQAIGNAFGFIDALAGSVLAAKNNSSILLLNPDSAKLPTTYLMSLKQPKTVFYLGGESVVSKDLKYSLSTYIGGTLQKYTTDFKMSGVQLRNLLSGTVLMSTDFDVNNDTANNAFALDGHGYGHGIGMSQWGAYRRSQAGHKAADILKFYYQNIEIEQASKYIK